MLEIGFREPTEHELKLTLNEHERITQIYTVRNANKKREKNMRNVAKYINVQNKT